MANVKNIKIIGELPFDCISNVELQPYLAAFNGPCYGLKIQWGQATMFPNEYGGQTATYDFTVSGEEAVHYEWYKYFVGAVKRANGTVSKVFVKDIENNQILVDN